MSGLLFQEVFLLSFRFTLCQFGFCEIEIPDAIQNEEQTEGLNEVSSFNDAWIFSHIRVKCLYQMDGGERQKKQAQMLLLCGLCCDWMFATLYAPALIFHYQTGLSHLTFAGLCWLFYSATCTWKSLSCKM